jgi:hypothetical protein
MKTAALPTLGITVFLMGGIDIGRAVQTMHRVT